MIFEKIIEIEKYYDWESIFRGSHKLIGSYIDTAFYIDTPLDAAMARRIFRDMSDASGEQIRKYIEKYIKYERPLYQYMIDNIMPDSDIVVDGLLPIHDIVDKIMSSI